MSITEIQPAADRARRVRRVLGSSVRANLEYMGDALAGFAIVTWDSRGDVFTSMHTAEGPVAPGLVPSFVGASLNRHVAIVLANTDTIIPIGDGA